MDCSITLVLHLALSIHDSCLCSNCYGVLYASTRHLDYICYRKAELTMLPVFTTLHDNLQRLVELSMAATVAEQGCMAAVCTYVTSR